MSITPPLSITPSVDVPARGSYTVDPERSQITFTTRHLFGLAKVSGNFRISAGQIVVAQPLTASSVRAEATASSFTTGNARRDAHVRSNTFLDAERHPAITFRSQHVAKDGDTWIVHGVLTVREKDAPLTLEVTTASARGDVLDLRAAGSVDRYAHGVTAMKGIAARYLRLTVAVRATKS